MALTLLSNPFLHKPLSPPTFSFSNNKKVSKVGWNQMMICCRKKDIHPEFHDDAKVYCNGELVMTTGGTKKEYVVDVWSGNHPFYLGSRSQLLIDADQVEKFRKKFGGLSDIMEIPVLKGEIVIPARLEELGRTHCVNGKLSHKRICDSMSCSSFSTGIGSQYQESSYDLPWISEYNLVFH